MAGGFYAAKGSARQLAVKPVVLALLVTGGVGLYSFRSFADPQGGPRPRPKLAALAASTSAVAIEAQRIAVVGPAPVVALAAPVAFVPAPIAAKARFAPSAASAPRLARPPRRVTGVFQPVRSPVETEFADIAEPAPAGAPEPVALAAAQPEVQQISTVPALPVVAVAAPDPAPVQLAPQVDAVAAPTSVSIPVVQSVPVSAPEPAELAPAAATPVASATGLTPAEPAPQPRLAVAPVNPHSTAPRADLAAPAVRSAARAATRSDADVAAFIPAGTRASYSRYHLADGMIEFAIPAKLDGQALGTLPLRIGSGDHVSVRLGDLLAMLQSRMDPVTYNRLSLSRAAGEYVDFPVLRRAGIDVRYDAALDQLVLGTK